MRPPKLRARRVRAALVGASSAIATVGAHACAGGGLPHGTALALVLMQCATVGALCACVDGDGPIARATAIITALGAAQLLGHLALALTGHHGAGALMPGPSMLAAHATAAVVLGVAISAVEYLYVVCASVLCWLRLFAQRTPRPAPRARRRTTNVLVARPVLVTGLGMRAPPATAATA